jgi:hypothetical protein
MQRVRDLESRRPSATGQQGESPYGCAHMSERDGDPFHQSGLSQNPFPQLADARYDQACLRLQKLGGDPIPNTEYIVETLQGFSPEFVFLVCSKYRPGEYVRFTVTIPDHVLGL